MRARCAYSVPQPRTSQQTVVFRIFCYAEMLAAKEVMDFIDVYDVREAQYTY